jgi:hypothetical protein
VSSKVPFPLSTGKLLRLSPVRAFRDHIRQQAEMASGHSSYSSGIGLSFHGLLFHFLFAELNQLVGTSRHKKHLNISPKSASNLRSCVPSLELDQWRTPASVTMIIYLQSRYIRGRSRCVRAAEVRKKG